MTDTTDSTTTALTTTSNASAITAPVMTTSLVSDRARQRRKFRGTDIWIKISVNTRVRADQICEELGITDREIEDTVSHLDKEERHRTWMNKGIHKGVEIRTNRADSGTPVFEGNNVDIAPLLASIREKGFVPVEAKLVRERKHYGSHHPQAGELIPITRVVDPVTGVVTLTGWRYVIRVVFSTEQSEDPHPDAQAVSDKFVVFVQGKVAQQAFCWTNGAVKTVNCLGDLRTTKRQKTGLSFSEKGEFFTPHDPNDPEKNPPVMPAEIALADVDYTPTNGLPAITDGKPVVIDAEVITETSASTEPRRRVDITRVDITPTPVNEVIVTKPVDIGSIDLDAD